MNVSDKGQELNNLKYCVGELNKRIKTDADNAWYWEIKRNTAMKILKVNGESTIGQIAQKDLGVTDIEQADLKAHHPLLQMNRGISPEINHEGAEWYQDFDVIWRPTLII